VESLFQRSRRGTGRRGRSASHVSRRAPASCHESSHAVGPMKTQGRSHVTNENWQRPANAWPTTCAPRTPERHPSLASRRPDSARNADGTLRRRASPSHGGSQALMSRAFAARALAW
jgi:hypothetical protein